MKYFLAAMLVSSSAIAHEPFVQGTVGGNLSAVDVSVPGFKADVDTNPGLSLGVMAGVVYDSGLVTAVEMTHDKFDGNIEGFSADVRTISLSGNVGYNVIGGVNVIAGVGASHIDVEDDTDVAFHWQTGIDFVHAVDDTISLVTSYRWKSVPQNSFDGVDYSHDIHSLSVGVRF